MATTPDNEQPGFETDVNELPEDQGGGSPDSLEDDPLSEDEETEQLDKAQEDAAEERKGGGYQ